MLTPRDMPRDPRFIPQRALVEVTIRTFQGRYLLTPSDELNAKLLAILLRAQHLFPVVLHAFAFLSNHLHLLMTVADAEQEAQFVGHLKKNIGDLIRRERGWAGTLWDGRAFVAVIADDATALERLEYICSNGVKEGLVAHPLDWPGVTSAPYLLHDKEVVADWQGAEDRAAARRHKQPITSMAYHHRYRVRLTPIPPLAGLAPERRRAYYRRMFDRIASAAAAERCGRPPLGADAVRRALPTEPHPLERPESRPPVILGRGKARAMLCAALEEFLDVYRGASERYLLGALDAAFPPGSFPPRRPFVPWQPGRQTRIVGPARLGYRRSARALHTTSSSTAVHAASIESGSA